jgi:DNA-binding LacI/PurR family transcriptional regulator
VQTDHAGSAGATAHLLGLGHGTVAHIAGPSTSFAAAERERGWRDTLEAAGLPSARSCAARSGIRLRGAQTLIGDGVGTALFVANDQMASALRALADHGARVPEDVSVVGFDDVATPPTTALRSRRCARTSTGAQAVAARRDARATTSSPPRLGRPALVMPAPLIVRDSTGPAPV